MSTGFGSSWMTKMADSARKVKEKADELAAQKFGEDDDEEEYQREQEEQQQQGQQQDQHPPSSSEFHATTAATTTTTAQPTTSGTATTENSHSDGQDDNQQNKNIVANAMSASKMFGGVAKSWMSSAAAYMETETGENDDGDDNQDQQHDNDMERHHQPPQQQPQQRPPRPPTQPTRQQQQQQPNSVIHLSPLTKTGDTNGQHRGGGQHGGAPNTGEDPTLPVNHQNGTTAMLTEQLTASRDENAQLQQQIVQWQQTYEQAKQFTEGMSRQLETQTSDFEAERVSLTVEIDQLKTQVTTLIAGGQVASEADAMLTEKVAGLENEKESLQQQVEQWQQTYEQAKEYTTTLSQQLEAQTTAHAAEIQQLKTEITSVSSGGGVSDETGDTAMLTGKVAGLEAEKDSLQQQVEQWQQTYEQAKAFTEELNQDLVTKTNDFETKTAAFESEKAQLLDEIVQLKLSIADFEIEKADADRRYSELQTTSVELQEQQTQEHMAECDAFRQTIDELKGASSESDAELASKLSALREEVAESGRNAQAQSSEFEMERSALKTEIEQLKTEITTLSSGASEADAMLTEKVAGLESEKESLQQQVEQWQQTYEQAKAYTESISQDLNEKTDEISRLNTELSETRQRNDEPNPFAKPQTKNGDGDGDSAQNPFGSDANANVGGEDGGNPFAVASEGHQEQQEGDDPFGQNVPPSASADQSADEHQTALRRVNELEYELQMVNEQLSTWQETYETAKSFNDTLQHELDEVTAERDSLMETWQQSKSDQDANVAQTDGNGQDANGLKSMLAEAETAREALEAERDGLQQQVEQWQQTYEQAKEYTESINSQLQVQTSEVERLTEELNTIKSQQASPSGPVAASDAFGSPVATAPKSENLFVDDDHSDPFGQPICGQDAPTTDENPFGGPSGHDEQSNPFVQPNAGGDQSDPFGTNTADDTAVQQRVTELEAEKDSLQQQVEQWQQTYEQAKVYTESVARELETKTKDFDSERTELQNTIDELESGIAALKKASLEIDEMQLKVSRLEADNEEQSKRAETAEEKVGGIEAEKDVIQQQVEQWQQTYEQAKKDTESIAEQMQAQSSEFESERVALKTEIEQLKADTTSTAGGANEASDAILTGKLAGLESEKESLQQQVQQWQQTYEQAKEYTESISNQLQAKTSEVERLTEELNTIKSQQASPSGPVAASDAFGQGATAPKNENLFAGDDHSDPFGQPICGQDVPTTDENPFGGPSGNDDQSNPFVQPNAGADQSDPFGTHTAADDTAVQQRVTELEAEKDSLQQQVEQWQQTYEQAKAYTESVAEQMQAQSSEFEVKQAELKAELAQLKADATTTAADANGADAMLTEKVAGLESEKESLQQQVEQWQQTYEQAKEYTESISNQLQVQTSEVEKLRHEVDTLRRSQTPASAHSSPTPAANASNEDLTAKVAALESERDGLNDSVLQWQQTYEQAKEYTESINNQLQAKTSEVERLTEELNTIKSQQASPSGPVAASDAFGQGATAPKNENLFAGDDHSDPFGQPICGQDVPTTDENPFGGPSGNDDQSNPFVQPNAGADQSDPFGTHTAADDTAVQQRVTELEAEKDSLQQQVEQWQQTYEQAKAYTESVAELMQVQSSEFEVKHAALKAELEQLKADKATTAGDANGADAILTEKVAGLESEKESLQQQVEQWQQTYEQAKHYSEGISQELSAKTAELEQLKSNAFSADTTEADANPFVTAAAEQTPDPADDGGDSAVAASPLQTKLAEAESAREALAAERDNLQQQVEQWQLTYEQAKEYTESISNQLQVQTSEVEKLRHEVDTLRRSQTPASAHSSPTPAADASNEDLTAKVAALESERDGLNDSVLQWQQTYEQAKEYTDRMAADLQTKTSEVERLTEELNTIKSQQASPSGPVAASDAFGQDVSSPRTDENPFGGPSGNEDQSNPFGQPNAGADTAMQQRVTELEAEKDSLQQQVEQWQQTYEQAKAFTERMTEDLTEKTAEVERLSKELAQQDTPDPSASSADQDALQQQVDHLSTETISLQQQVEQWQQTYAQAKQYTESIAEQMKAQSSEFEVERAALKTEIEQLNTEITTLSSGASADAMLTEKVAGLESEKESLQQQVEQWQQTYEQAKEYTENLSQEVQAKNQQIEELTEKQSVSEPCAMDKKEPESNQTGSETSDELVELRAKCENLENELVRINEQWQMTYDHAKTINDQLTQQVADRASEIHTLNEKINTLKSSLEQQQDAMPTQPSPTDNNQNNNTAQQKIETLEQELQQLTEKVATLEKEKNAAETKVLYTNRQMQELLDAQSNNSSSDSEQQLAATRQRLHDAETTLATVGENRAAAEDDARRFREMISQIMKTALESLVCGEYKGSMPKASASGLDVVKTLGKAYQEATKGLLDSGIQLRQWADTYEHAKEVNEKMNEKISTAEKEAADARDSLQLQELAYQDQLAQAQQQQEALRMQISQAVQATQAAEEKVREYEIQLTQLQTNNGSSSASFATPNQQHRTGSIDTSGLGGEVGGGDLDALRNQLADREYELAETRQTVSNLENALEAFNSQKKQDTEEMMRDHQHEVESLAAEILKLRSEGAGNRDEVNTIEREYRKEIGAKNSTIGAMQRKLAELRKSMEQSVLSMQDDNSIDKRIVTRLLTTYVTASSLGQDQQASDIVRVMAGLLSWDEGTMESAGLVPGVGLAKQVEEYRKKNSAIGWGRTAFGALVKHAAPVPEGKQPARQSAPGASSPTNKMSLGELWVNFLIAQSDQDRQQQDELLKAQTEGDAGPTDMLGALGLSSDGPPPISQHQHQSSIQTPQRVEQRSSPTLSEQVARQQQQHQPQPAQSQFQQPPAAQAPPTRFGAPQPLNQHQFSSQQQQMPSLNGMNNTFQ